MIDITKGNDWSLRIALTREGEPFPVTSATGLAVNVVSPYGRKTALTPTVRSGLIHCEVGGYDLPCGTHGIEVAKTGENNWRTFGSAMLRITNETTNGDNNASIGGDDYDVIMDATGIVVNLSMAVDGQAGGGGGGVTPEEFIALEQRVYALEEGKEDNIVDLDDIRSGAALGATSVQEESDPTVPDWAKGSEPTLATLQDDEGHTTVSETEKSEWSGKEEKIQIATSVQRNTLVENTFYKLSTPLSGNTKYFLPTGVGGTIVTIGMTFTTASDFTSLTISAPLGVSLRYYEGYSIVPEKEYELNLLFDGSKWIISHAVIGTT